AELDVIASMQPCHATSDWRFALQAWGEERCKFSYNPRVQLDNGARVAFGSDAPVERFHPLEGVYAAVSRQTMAGNPDSGWMPELRLTMQEALEGFTKGAAYAAGMENRLGQLREGYLADMVVLDKNLFEIESSEILETQVVATMTDGEWRYGGVE
ncbi:MAG: amidohydrolase family protein, partial [Aggregatilineales bacterium]